MDYCAEYQKKLTTIDAVLDSIQSGSVLTASQAANEPTAIFDRLHELYGRVHNVKMYGPMCCFEHPFMMDPKYRDTFDIDVAFLMGDTRKSLASNSISYFPSHMHDGAQRWMDANGAPDLFLCAVSPMDKHGYFTIPLCLAHERSFFNAAKRVAVQVNPNLPRTRGDTAIHVSQVDMIVEAATPLPYLPKSQPTETDQAIGRYVASLVNDGDCIQLGIGGIPDAAAMSLMDKHDLGLHTEQFTSSMADLIDAGVITGARKAYDQGMHVGVFADGTHELYQYLHNNPKCIMKPGPEVLNPHNIARQDHMVSINTLVEIDLTGQVCAESIGPVQYSGSGGGFCFTLGTYFAEHGKGILCFQSRTKKGMPKIKATLTPGAVVTHQRNYIQYVVTENGIADLRGTTVRERAKMLINLAHPDDREELTRAAKELYYF